MENEVFGDYDLSDLIRTQEQEDALLCEYILFCSQNGHDYASADSIRDFSEVLWEEDVERFGGSLGIDDIEPYINTIAKQTKETKMHTDIQDERPAPQPKPITLVFDNSGGVQLQTSRYTGNFAPSEDELTELKWCILSALLEGNDGVCWDGNEPDTRIEYDYETDRSGGYKWIKINTIHELHGYMRAVLDGEAPSGESAKMLARVIGPWAKDEA